jgi:hypothetical protein
MGGTGMLEPHAIAVAPADGRAAKQLWCRLLPAPLNGTFWRCK